VSDASDLRVPEIVLLMVLPEHTEQFHFTENCIFSS
jgi:hypothetical protein